MRPSDVSLARDYLRDLIVEIRCARRDGHAAYAVECVQKVKNLWRKRHNTHPDRYGCF